MEGGDSLTLGSILASSTETRIHTWVHGVNLNFGKNKSLCSLHLHLFCGFEELSIRHLCFGCGFEELSIRHLCFGDIVVSYVQDLREPAQGTSLSRLYNWDLNLHSFISTTLIVFTLLCMHSEVPSCRTQKFRVHLLSCPNSKVPGLADSKFNSLHLSKNL